MWANVATCAAHAAPQGRLPGVCNFFPLPYRTGQAGQRREKAGRGGRQGQNPPNSRRSPRVRSIPLVPTLRVGTCVGTLCVPHCGLARLSGTQSVQSVVPTQSVGTRGAARLFVAFRFIVPAHFLGIGGGVGSAPGGSRFLISAPLV